ncbi:hypothetical protein ACGFIK_14310 [Micromonospora sp. NPDC048871]|uniref:hypothetical protein n=1 Tax=unclassified Micromonospora TaxID=2617518 RepID=UPI002E0DDC6E|nr:hypothetical protein OIE53_11350 [Micromonospora sp. NBC_01739]
MVGAEVVIVVGEHAGAAALAERGPRRATEIGLTAWAPLGNPCWPRPPGDIYTALSHLPSRKARTMTRTAVSSEELDSSDPADPRLHAKRDSAPLWPHLRARPALHRRPERTDQPGSWLITRNAEAMVVYRDKDRFTNCQVGGAPLTDRDVPANCCGLIIGGDETGRHAIASGLPTLIEHPVPGRALKAGETDPPTAADEALRWTDPSPHGSRIATEDVEVDGNRDPAVSADSDRFTVDRHPNKYGMSTLPVALDPETR